ncbi:MAG: prepilin-type N-terminal cleavage/methylation domain-containing protein [Cyanobacteria bacterium P01_A01_bin.135]
MSFIASLRHRWHQHHSLAPESDESGFTLIELLVTIILASGIVAGVMYLAVEVLQADQRESDRTETQRDMQAALTFMESELRQAVFVYDANCLAGVPDDPASPDLACDGLDAAWGLNLPGDMEPVLAFWRLQPFPPAVQAACAGGTANADVPCLSGNSYTLVVYSLGTRDGGGDDLAALKGEAGIFRSEMSIAEPTAAGYISPFRGAVASFRNWPDGDGFAATNRPTFSEPALLVDYVDSGAGSLGAGDAPSCPTPTDFYQLTPNDAAGVPRSFYACVSNSDVDSATAGNQDVVLYLRGDAVGRSGLQRDGSFLPTLESRVFIRGTLDKSPV